MGYSITTPTDFYMTTGGMNWAFASDEKESEDVVRLKVEFETAYMISGGGHFAIGLFPTTAGTHGEVSSHYQHPGAIRGSNKLWIQGLGVALGGSGLVFERWEVDNKRFYTKEFSTAGLSDNETYRVTLAYRKSNKNLYCLVQEQSGGSWVTLDSGLLTGWDIPDPQDHANEDYWYGFIGSGAGDSSVPGGGDQAIDHYDWNGSQYVKIGSTGVDPNYQNGQLNDSVPTNPYYFTINEMIVDQYT